MVTKRPTRKSRLRASENNPSSLVVVRLPPLDSDGTVELLRNHTARKLMREREPRKRPSHICRLQNRVVEAHCAPQYKLEIADAPKLPLRQQSAQLLGRELLPQTVEGHRVRVRLEPAENGFTLPRLDPRLALRKGNLGELVHFELDVGREELLVVREDRLVGLGEPAHAHHAKSHRTGKLSGVKHPTARAEITLQEEELLAPIAFRFLGAVEGMVAHDGRHVAPETDVALEVTRLDLIRALTGAGQADFLLHLNLLSAGTLSFRPAGVRTPA